MTERPTPDSVTANARQVQLEFTPETAARIAHAVGPAVELFAPVAASLPFDLEPATFLVTQRPAETQK